MGEIEPPISPSELHVSVDKKSHANNQYSDHTFTNKGAITYGL